MGNLLDILRKDGKKPSPNVFIDFEHAEPTEAEAAVYGEVKSVLAHSAEIIHELDDYKGAGDAIRNAISQPSNEEVQTQTWAVLIPLVQKLQKFHDYSHSLDESFHKLLRILCSEDAISSLKKYQALARQLADIIHFVLKFDELKLSNPAIQNDFSYYRRSLNRLKTSDPAGESRAVVSDEDANRMSLFYAYPTPMLKCISESTNNFVKENRAVPVDNTTEILAVMATVCREMVTTPEYSSRFENPETLVFCQRVMVGAIVLYDQVHAIGAFSRRNPAIDMRACIQALHTGETVHTRPLLDALRYSTKHLNDEDTPPAIKKMLA